MGSKRLAARDPLPRRLAPHPAPDQADLRAESTIIHPPVEVERFRSDQPDDYFLAVTELVPRKRIELAAEGRARPGND